MNEHIDIDASGIITGSSSIDQVGRKIFDKISVGITFPNLNGTFHWQKFMKRKKRGTEMKKTFPMNTSVLENTLR